MNAKKNFNNIYELKLLEGRAIWKLWIPTQSFYKAETAVLQNKNYSFFRLFIGKTDICKHTQREREVERERTRDLLSGGSLSNWATTAKIWAKPKAGAENSILFSFMSSRDGPFRCIGSWAARTPASMECHCPMGCFNHCTTTPAPNIVPSKRRHPPRHSTSHPSILIKSKNNLNKRLKRKTAIFVTNNRISIISEDVSGGRDGCSWYPVY